ncbi:MAG: hypothetical protein QXH24_06740 [Candidatus Bathyarchaeia archaeon]
MYSAKANSTDIDVAIRKWSSTLPSRILTHENECCRIVKDWFISVDHSLFMINGSPFSGPTWIGEKYMWGPSKRPIYWCDLIKLRSLDCGALAALAQELFKARGVSTFPVQLIQQYSEQSIRHWRKKWGDLRIKDWIVGTLAYHEACAIVTKGNNIKIWDPTDNCWILPQQPKGYEAVVAIRIISQTILDELKWNSYTIKPNIWIKISEIINK